MLVLGKHAGTRGGNWTRDKFFVKVFSMIRLQY